MVSQQSVCLRRLGEGRAGEVRFGRFMNNERVTVEELVAGVCRGTGARCAGAHVLAIEDSSELNYQAHARRVSGLGTVGNGHAARVKVVVASVTQLSAEYVERWQPC